MVIGGDDSVAWSVAHKGSLEVDQDQEKRKLHERHPARHAVNLWKGEGYAEGRDPVNTDGKYFKIEIKLPKADAIAFANEVVRAAQNPSGGKIIFTLPIEARNYDQISIDWPYSKTGSAV